MLLRALLRHPFQVPSAIGLWRLCVHTHKDDIISRLLHRQLKARERNKPLFWRIVKEDPCL